MGLEARPVTKERMWWSGAAGVVASILLGGLMLQVTTQVLGDYGWGAFFVLPGVIGFVSAICLGWSTEPSFGECTWLGFCTSCVVLAVSGVALLVSGAEGMICLVMAGPIGFISVFLGSCVGYEVSKTIWKYRRERQIMVSLLIGVPGVLVGLHFLPPLESRVVTTRVNIRATPEQIWPLLQNLLLDPPEETLFQAALAHPISIETEDPRVGGERTCRLSRGDMPETITVYEVGKCLEFRVLRTPPTMRELNPLHAVSPRHLEGYFECLRGRFDLVRLQDGSTDLVGTTWYQHRLAPTIYWNFWTDEIVHQVHRRVMNAIGKRVAAGLHGVFVKIP